MGELQCQGFYISEVSEARVNTHLDFSSEELGPQLSNSQKEGCAVKWEVTS